MDKVDLIAAAGITAGHPEGFRPRCPRCRYDLTGLADGLCPECGALFTLRGLLEAWRAERARPRGGGAFAIGVICFFLAMPPADVRSPGVLTYKGVALGGLWAAAWVWTRLKRDDLLLEGHRLLWLWAPCLSTALALAETPVVSRINGAAMLLLAGVIALKSYRRSPVPTTLILTAAVSIPVAFAAFTGFGLVTGGMAGRGAGEHWSFADYPGWYWRGMRGRARGISNGEAVRIGAWMLGLAALAVAGLAPLWMRVGAGFVRARAGRRAPDR